MGVCVGICVLMCVRVCVCMCGIYEWAYTCLGGVCVNSSYLCIWLRGTAIQTRLVRSGPNPDSCLQSDDTPGDSKADTRDNSEIHTGSCSIN